MESMEDEVEDARAQVQQPQQWSNVPTLRRTKGQAIVEQPVCWVFRARIGDLERAGYSQLGHYECSQWWTC